MIERWLDPGERRIWSGRPRPGGFAVRKAGANSLLGIPFLAFSLFWIHQAGRSGGWSWLFGIPFVLIGLSLVLAPAWHYWRAGRTTYVLTDRRAIIDTAGPSALRQSFPLAAITDVELQPAADGSGHVIFHKKLIPGARGNAVQQDGFVAIDNVEEVDRLLRKAVDKASQRLTGAAA